MDNVLFHTVKCEHIEDNLRRNSLRGYSTHRWHKNGTIPWLNASTGYKPTQEYAESDWYFGVCLTRSFDFASNWGDGVVLVLDKDKLKHNHKLVPYNWMETRVKAEYEEFLVLGNPHIKAKDAMEHMGCKTWRENNAKLIDDESYMGTLSNLHKYLKGFVITATKEGEQGSFPMSEDTLKRIRDYNWKNLSSAMDKVLDYANKYRIPVFIDKYTSC